MTGTGAGEGFGSRVARGDGAALFCCPPPAGTAGAGAAAGATAAAFGIVATGVVGCLFNAGQSSWPPTAGAVGADTAAGAIGATFDTAAAGAEGEPDAHAIARIFGH